MTNYKVLRPVTPADLDTRPGLIEALKLIPPEGYVTSTVFKHLEKHRARRGMAHACSIGVLKIVSPHDRVLKLDSVRVWCAQLNESGHKNMQSESNTRIAYLGKLTRLDEWLQGRSFQSYETAIIEGKMVRQAVTKSFGNVEELMQYCHESDYGTKTAQRVVREYLASMQATGMPVGVHLIARSSIKSYFDAHDVVLDLRKAKKNRTGATATDVAMSIEDVYKLLNNGTPSISMRTAILIKFQSGMDTSTFTDRFNYEGYRQIVKYFRNDDYTMWNLEMCPVPIKMVRVKTDRPYTTFLDRDAIAQLREYLAWKETKYGRHDASKPLFLTKQGMPIRLEWISKGFSEVAIRAGIQEKVSRRVYKIRAHEVRDLLKSTLNASGCAPYAADHVLGHAPRDSYEKEAILYPEELRREYAKASSRINIITKAAGNMNSPDDPASQNVRIQELETKIKELTKINVEKDILKGEYANSMKDLDEKVNRIARVLDKLPDNIKEEMSDELDGLN